VASKRAACCAEGIPLGLRGSDERQNLAEDPAHREALLDMVKRMWRKMKEIGDNSLFGTHYATLRTAPIGPNSIEQA